MKKRISRFATVWLCLLAAGRIAVAEDTSAKVMSLAYDGLTAAEKGHYDQAIALFTSALQLGPTGKTAVRLHAERGKAYLDKGDADNAIKDYDEAIKLDPSYAVAFTGRGNAYNGKGDLDKAIADYSEAIRLDQNYAPAYVGRSVAYNRKEARDLALADANMAVSLDPKIVAAYQNQNPAAEDYDKEIQLDPNDAGAFVRRGSHYRETGMYDKAIADFNTAIKLDPHYPVACNELAWLLATCPVAALRDGKKAVEYARQACELSQWKRPDEVDTLAAAFAEAGDFDNAVKYEQQYLATPGLDEKAAAIGKDRLALYQSHKAYREDNSQ